MQHIVVEVVVNGLGNELRGGRMSVSQCFGQKQNEIEEENINEHQN
jgi:hypothetical protein